MNRNDNSGNYIISFGITVVVYLIIAALCGCGTSHKVVQSGSTHVKEQTKIDSARAAHTDSVTTSTDKSIVVDSSAFERGEVKVEEETYNLKDSIYTRKTTTIKNGRKVSTRTTTKNLKDSTRVIKSDSTTFSKKAAKDSTSTTKSKEVKRSGFRGWVPWWLLWIVVIVLAAYNAIKFFNPAWATKILSWIKK